jgi:hypothetical protein
MSNSLHLTRITAEDAIAKRKVTLERRIRSSACAIGLALSEEEQNTGALAIKSPPHRVASGPLIPALTPGLAAVSCNAGIGPVGGHSRSRYWQCTSSTQAFGYSGLIRFQDSWSEHGPNENDPWRTTVELSCSIGCRRFSDLGILSSPFQTHVSHAPNLCCHRHINRKRLESIVEKLVGHASSPRGRSMRNHPVRQAK